jgi:hypothetical protein
MSGSLRLGCLGACSYNLSNYFGQIRHHRFRVGAKKFKGFMAPTLFMFDSVQWTTGLQAQMPACALMCCTNDPLHWLLLGKLEDRVSDRSVHVESLGVYPAGLWSLQV